MDQNFYRVRTDRIGCRVRGEGHEKVMKGWRVRLELETLYVSRFAAKALLAWRWNDKCELEDSFLLEKT